MLRFSVSQFRVLLSVAQQRDSVDKTLEMLSVRMAFHGKDDQVKAMVKKTGLPWT